METTFISCVNRRLDDRLRENDNPTLNDRTWPKTDARVGGLRGDAFIIMALQCYRDLSMTLHSYAASRDICSAHSQSCH